MFAKGHGTQNDFVLLPDLDGRLTLDPAAVAALCDRRRGIGADGVLRVTTAGAAADAGVFDRLPEGVGAGRLVHGLPQRRRLDRADVRQRRSGVRALPAGQRAGDAATSSSSARWRARGRWYSTALTPPPPTSPSRWARPTSSARARRPWADGRFTGLAVDVGNPHLACVDPDADRRRAGRARRGRAGAVRHRAVPRRRQHRGDHRSAVVRCRCGYTSAVSAKPVRVERAPSRPPSPRWHTRVRRPAHLQVCIPGGEVTVTITDASSYLRGPSVLVANGEISEEWWRAQQR